MSHRGAPAAFPPPNPETHYAIRAVDVQGHKGGAIRAVRRERGIDVGAAARALRMRVMSLLAVELGNAEFVNASDYRRATELLTKAPRKGTS